MTALVVPRSRRRSPTTHSRICWPHQPSTFALAPTPAIEAPWTCRRRSPTAPTDPRAPTVDRGRQPDQLKVAVPRIWTHPEISAKQLAKRGLDDEVGLHNADRALQPKSPGSPPGAVVGPGYCALLERVDERAGDVTIVRALVDAHGGRPHLRHSDGPGTGATFTIHLPAR